MVVVSCLWTENWLAASDEAGFPAVLPRMCPKPPLSASSLLLISYFLPILFFPVKTSTCLTLPGFDSSIVKSDFHLQSCLHDSPLNNQVLSIFPHLKVLPWSQSFILFPTMALRLWLNDVRDVSLDLGAGLSPDFPFSLLSTPWSILVLGLWD